MSEVQCPLLIDAMLPGDGTWPAASVALAGGDWMAGLDEALDGRCREIEGELAGMEPMGRVERIVARLGTKLGAVQRVVYTAYYSSAPVAGVIAALAEAGPRDDQALVDAGLVASVARDKRGVMR